VTGSGSGWIRHITQGVERWIARTAENALFSGAAREVSYLPSLVESIGMKETKCQIG